MRILGAAAAGLIAVHGLYAQQALPAGHYEGRIKAPNHEVNIALDLDKNDKQVWIGSLDINMPNAPKGIPIDAITVTGDSVSWQVKSFGNALFKAKLNAEEKTLNGTTSTPGGDVPFELKRTGDGKVNLPPPSTPISKDFEAVWEGTVDMGQPLRLVVTFASGPDGKGMGEVVSVDQNGVKLPISTVTQQGNKLNFEIRQVGGSYEGTLNEAKTEIAGTWTQLGNTAPLALKKKTPASN